MLKKIFFFFSFPEVDNFGTIIVYNKWWGISTQKSMIMNKKLTFFFFGSNSMNNKQMLYPKKYIVSKIIFMKHYDLLNLFPPFCGEYCIKVAHSFHTMSFCAFNFIPLNTPKDEDYVLVMVYWTTFLRCFYHFIVQSRGHWGDIPWESQSQL